VTRGSARACLRGCAAEEGSRESVDAGCRRLTASWVRDAALKDTDIETCSFFEGHEKAGQEALLPPGAPAVGSVDRGP
jgi:DNA excision repair protein ERCC-2